MAENKDGNYDQAAIDFGNNNKVVGIPCYPGLEYRSKIVFCTCIHCGQQGETDVSTAWSIKNYLCCYYCGWYWKCMQLIRGKEWTLKDAVHKCKSCHKVIANYQAC